MNQSKELIPLFPEFFALDPVTKLVETMVIEEYGAKFLYCCATTIVLQIKEHFNLDDILN